MTVAETLPLPRDQVRDGNDFTFRAHDLHAWPDQELFLHFEYNPLRERYVFEVEHSRAGRLFPKSTATLEKNYSVWPYILFKFINPSGREGAVTTRNLRDTVELAVYPGPLGGHFHPEADIDEAEERRILRRRFFDPVR